MNKKILIGSIIAVVILILVSFTSVVGFHSVKSTSAINSPLFGIRTSRAIGQGQQDINTDYLGHGEETNIHISRMERAEKVQKAIDIISKFDDKAFSILISRIIFHIKYQEQMNDKEISDTLQALHHIRENPNVINYYGTGNNPIDETYEYLSCRWFPGCWIIFYTLVDIIAAIIEFFTHLFNCYPPTSAGACPTVGCPL